MLIHMLSVGRGKLSDLDVLDALPLHPISLL